MDDQIVLENYWTERYGKGETGWDIGHVSTPIKEYVDQLEDKELKILIPGLEMPMKRNTYGIMASKMYGCSISPNLH